MAEDIYFDEFDLTPDKEVSKEERDKKQILAEKEEEFQQKIRDLVEQGKDKKLTATDVIFGPDVELAGDSFLVGGKLARSIKSKFTEEDYKVDDVDPFTGFAAGIVDATIKIPYGFVALSAEIADALREEGVPVDKGYVAQLERYFSNSVLGKIQEGAEDVVKESAVGRLTSALTQLYSLGRVGASAAVKGATKAKQIYNKYATAAKANRVVKANKNAVNAGIRAKELNKLTGLQKFGAVTLGGAGGTAFVADVEDIGTWGDWLGGPTKLNREQRKSADEDATRKLWNRFKFGVEGAAISVPIAYGINRVAKRITEAGKNLKYSDDRLDQLINKYLIEPFAPSGNKSQALFENLKRVEGQQAGAQVTAKDLIMDIDQTLYKIAKESGLSTRNKNWKRIVGRLDELLTSTDDVISDGGIIFKGFDKKELGKFYSFLDEVGLTKQQGKVLVNEMTKVRHQFNNFKNQLFKGGNINAANKEFVEIMGERMRNIFNSEYQIAEGKKILPWLNYKPTSSQIDEVKSIFERYGKENGVKLTAQDLDDIIDDVFNNISFNPITKTPEFPLTVLSVLDDNATQIINIADNIKGGQFKASTLIKSEADLRAFQRFYGQKRDLRNTIINTMSDLATLTAKDNFYNTIAKSSDDLIANGERAVVYPTRMQALRGLPNQKIIADKNGLQIKSPLGESVYTNPLNGKFTSQEWKDALTFSEKLITDDFAKNVIWQHAVLIPKGLTQISKTILGPFTHTRNFITAGQFSLATGNLLKNPVTMVKNFRTAWNTIQPQLLYRNAPKDQALYKWLLDEQVVSSSASARDIAGLLDDIGTGGDVYMKFFGKFGKAMKKLYEKAGDLYVAEDDLWKVYNFLSEIDTYTNAYKAALQKGLIKEMPSTLSIWKEAANIVRNTVPNYNYVGTFGQNMRRSPLGNFISFPIEVTRTATNIAELGLKEMKNPVFRNVGMKRLTGFTTALATAPVVMASVLAGMYGVTKTAISAVRELVAPSFSQDSTLFVIRDKDGKLKYIDASGSMVYDTVVNPLQSIVAASETERVFDEKAPLTVGVLNGMARGLGRFIQPYVDESIYFSVMNNLFLRKGVTADGRRLWNPDAPRGEKIKAATKYFLEEVAPLSYKQFARLQLAARDKPGPRGEKYELSDEIAGFYGLRPIKIDPIKSLNYKINEFKEELRNTRALYTSEVLKGGPVDPSKIVERFYVANRERFQKFRKMKRKIEAARILEAKEDDIMDLFAKRQEKKNFSSLEDNTFIPMTITKSQVVESERIKEQLEKDFGKTQLPRGLDDKTVDIIFDMIDDMYGIKLDQNFEKQVPLDKYLNKLGPRPGNVSSVAPLPQQPMPSQQVIQPQPQLATADGLTPTENALLSEEEKAIRLRQRGITNYG